jgi:hypothetical protein
MTLRLFISGVLVNPRFLRNNKLPVRIEHQRLPATASKPSSKRTGPKEAKHRGRATSGRRC